MKKIKSFSTKEDWLLWRAGKIGASDAPIIAGLSPYKTREKLLDEKRTGEPKEESNSFILNRGHNYERIMRPIAEGVLGLSLKPSCAESLKTPYMAASLDGFDFAKNVAWECKLVGQKIYETCCLTKEVPPKYVHQIQQQIYVYDLEKVWFWCGTDEINYTYFEVYPDEEIIKELLENNKDFWKLLKAPVEVPTDFKESLIEVSKVKEQIKGLQKREKELMDRLSFFDIKGKFELEGVKYERKTLDSGDIDYKIRR